MFASENDTVTWNKKYQTHNCINVKINNGIWKQHSVLCDDASVNTRGKNNNAVTVTIIAIAAAAAAATATLTIYSLANATRRQMLTLALNSAQNHFEQLQYIRMHFSCNGCRCWMKQEKKTQFEFNVPVMIQSQLISRNQNFRRILKYIPYECIQPQKLF